MQGEIADQSAIYKDFGDSIPVNLDWLNDPYYVVIDAMIDISRIEILEAKTSILLQADLS